MVNMHLHSIQDLVYLLADRAPLTFPGPVQSISMKAYLDTICPTTSPSMTVSEVPMGFPLSDLCSLLCTDIIRLPLRSPLLYPLP